MGGKRYSIGLKVVESNLANQIKEGYSFETLKQFEDSFLDIVYIDTDHTYETTWKELLICSKKVKVNGFICGHDYTKYNCFSRLDYGIYDAVNRFCVEYDYELCYLTMEKEGFHSYALRKIQ